MARRIGSSPTRSIGGPRVPPARLADSLASAERVLSVAAGDCTYHFSLFAFRRVRVYSLPLSILGDRGGASSDGGCGLVTFLRCPPRACAVCAGRRQRRGTEGWCAPGWAPTEPEQGLQGLRTVWRSKSPSAELRQVFCSMLFPFENPESLYGLVVTALPHLTTPVRSW